MRRFNLTILLLLCLFVTSCTTGNDLSDPDGVVSDDFGQIHDIESGMIISVRDERVSLVHCIIDTPAFTLPVEFRNDLKINAVGFQSFSQREEIVELTVPNGYEYIGFDAFSGCPNLEKVYLGKDVSYISSGSFTDCPNLKKIDVSSENLYLYEKDGCVIDKTSRRLIATNGNIPEGTEIIGDYVFSNNKNLTNLSVPEGIVIIEVSAFARSSVASVSLPDTLTTIAKYAFMNCTELKEIYIPKSVDIIYGRILYGVDGIVINCEADSQPEGWDDMWLDGCTNYQLNWGVERE